MEESRRQFVAALTAGVTGALAGCGGGESTTPSEDASETPTATATQTPTTPAGETQVVSVGADGLRFSPDSFEIQPGDTVRWEWESDNHNVKPSEVPDGSDWSGTPDSEIFDSGHTYSYTFETPGEYSYYCNPHRSVGMAGSFTVTEQ